MLNRRVVGFDDLGNTDEFSTARLEYRLIESGKRTTLSTNMQGVILRPRIEGESKASNIFGFKGKNRDQSPEYDSDE
jgi:hypothetical protein